MFAFNSLLSVIILILRNYYNVEVNIPYNFIKAQYIAVIKYKFKNFLEKNRKIENTHTAKN